MDKSGVTANNNSVKDCFLLLLLTAFIYLPFLGCPVVEKSCFFRVKDVPLSMITPRFSGSARSAF